MAFRAVLRDSCNTCWCIMSTLGCTSALVRFAPRSGATVRLLCIPFAGGGASAFRLWSAGLPPMVDVMVAQLPGRETRLRERPLTSIGAMVEHLRPAVTAHADLPFAIFGHSMGALVGLELARALRADGLPGPVHLFVSASNPPRRRETDLPPLHTLPDDALVAELDRRYGGVPAAVREQRELMELLLPMLRGDVTALETYRARELPPLDCPITAYAGSSDALATPESMRGWGLETSGRFHARTFDGGHFFINTHRDPLLADVLAALAPAGAREGAA